MATVAEIKEIIAGIREQIAVAKRDITEIDSSLADLLAFDLYSDSRLWWTFAARNPNRLADPFFDFVVGVGIYLPKPELIRSVLGL
jgi:hypothetical protein